MKNAHLIAQATKTKQFSKQIKQSFWNCTYKHNWLDSIYFKLIKKRFNNYIIEQNSCNPWIWFKIQKRLYQASIIKQKSKQSLQISNSHAYIDLVHNNNQLDNHTNEKKTEITQNPYTLSCWNSHFNLISICELKIALGKAILKEIGFWVEGWREEVKSKLFSDGNLDMLIWSLTSCTLNCTVGIVRGPKCFPVHGRELGPF